MKNTRIAISMVFCINLIFLPYSVSAQSEADIQLGRPEMCLDTTRLKETMILDNRTILFIMQGGKLYLSRLPFDCPGLKTADGFSYSTSIAKICKQDIISVLWPDSFSGNKCGLGKFWPLNYKGSPKDAIKLLRNGLLAQLVAKDAFIEPISGDEP